MLKYKVTKATKTEPPAPLMAPRPLHNSGSSFVSSSSSSSSISTNSTLTNASPLSSPLSAQPEEKYNPTHPPPCDHLHQRALSSSSSFSYSLPSTPSTLSYSSSLSVSSTSSLLIYNHTCMAGVYFRDNTWIDRFRLVIFVF